MTLLLLGTLIFQQIWQQLSEPTENLIDYWSINAAAIFALLPQLCGAVVLSTLYKVVGKAIIIG